MEGKEIKQEVPKEQVYNIKYTKEELEQEANALLNSDELQLWFNIQKKLKKYDELASILNKI